MFTCSHCKKEKSDSEEGYAPMAAKIGFFLFPYWCYVPSKSKVCKTCAHPIKLIGFGWLLFFGDCLGYMDCQGFGAINQDARGRVGREGSHLHIQDLTT
jgi:hypothetical protein